MTVRLPRLLNPDGTERCRLVPARLTLDLTLTPLSTAEMTLPDGDPDICVRDLVELYDENGSVGVFRVAEIESQPGLTRLVRLEHGLCTLADGVVPASAFSGSAREALTTLLSHQPEARWALGDVALPDDITVIFTCGCQNLLSALMELLALLPDGLMFDFDQQTLPWTLHLKEMSDADACEGRLSRNLTSLTMVTDGSDICTRVYPFGAGQGTERISLQPLTGQDYLDSGAASAWGMISHTFTAPSIFDSPTLLAVAEKYLERHSAPIVSLTATGIDLSAATGEPADHFRLGQLCRLALPEKDVTLHERIIGIRKPDVISAPGQVTLTLSNRISDASDEIADLLREVTASRVIGGRITDVRNDNRASGSSTAGIAHYFNVENWAAVLACTASFEPDYGVKVLNIWIDNTKVPSSEWSTGQFDALPYLKRNDLGLIAPGRHTFFILPDSGYVSSSVVMKVIEKI